MEIKTKSIGDCWLKSISYVFNKGILFHDENVKIKEVLGFSVKINNPKLDDEIIDKYGDGAIVEHTLNKFRKGVVMDDRPFTYAERIYNKNGIDQFGWLVKRLKNKNETKSATICLLNEGSISPNIPCLTTIDAKIRNNKLNLQFFYRSQNIVGRQYANLLALAHLQAEIAKECSVKIGELFGYVASAHIYEYDFDFAESVIKDAPILLKDRYYTNGPNSIRTIKTGGYTNK